MRRWRSSGSPLRLLFSLIFLGIFAIIGLDVLSPVYIRDVLRGDAGLFGLIIGLIGLGTLCASLGLMARKKQSSPWHDSVCGLFLLALIPGLMWLSLLFLSHAAARLAILAGSLVGGLGNGLLQIQLGTLLQLLSPPEALGRIGGLFQSTATAGQLAGMLAPPLLVPGVLAAGGYFGLIALALLLLAACVTLILRRKGFHLVSSSTAPEAEEKCLTG